MTESSEMIDNMTDRNMKKEVLYFWFVCMLLSGLIRKKNTLYYVVILKQIYYLAMNKNTTEKLWQQIKKQNF